MNIAAGDIVERDRKLRSPRSVMSQRADELSDEQLMTRLSGPGVEAALSKLYGRYSRTVHGVGLNILGERSLAEELVQKVFLKVWRSSSTFDASRASFSTLLYRVTRSVAVREASALEELADLLHHREGDRRLVGIDADQHLHARTHLHSGRTRDWRA